MQIMNLFPTPVGVSHLERELLESEKKTINNQEIIPNKLNSTSINRNILEHVCLKEISKFIKNKLELYFDEIYKPKDEISIYITQSWLNLTKPGESHHKHAHSNSLISGVFYIQADENFDKICFAVDDYQAIKIEARSYNQFNSDMWWIPVKTGQLVLFPSSLQHYVEKTASNNDRISIAFNSFIKGKLGNNLSATELKLR